MVSFFAKEEKISAAVKGNFSHDENQESAK
jgi:hypothetical protein